MKYFILHERGKYKEVNAHCLDDVTAYCKQQYGGPKFITDTRQSKLLDGRKFSGMAELPYGYAFVID